VLAGSRRRRQTSSSRPLSTSGDQDKMFDEIIAIKRNKKILAKMVESLIYPK